MRLPPVLTLQLPVSPTAHRGAATLNNLVAGRWLSIDEGKQGDADRI